MENFNLDFFNERKAKVSELATKYNDLKITKENLTEGKEAIKELKNERVEITKIAKETRSQALAFQKGVIQLEKDILSIIEPIEKELMNQRMIVENEELLPERKKKLEEINVDVEDSILLKMTNVEYKNFYKKEQEKYLDEQVRIAKEKEAEEKRKKELEEAKEQARIDAEKKAKADEERKKIEEKEKADSDLNEERYKIVDSKGIVEYLEYHNLAFLFQLSDSEFLNLVEKAEIKKKAEEEAEAEKLEQEEKERAEKNNRYLAWRKAHNYNPKTDKITQNGNEFTLTRVISTIVID